MSGILYRAAYFAPIFALTPCLARAGAPTCVFPFSSWPDRIVPFALSSGAATLSTSATRSPISPSQSMRYSTLLSPPQSRIHHLPSGPSRAKISLEYKANARLHPLCTGIVPTANLSVQCAPCFVFSVLASFASRRTSREGIENTVEDIRGIPKVTYFLRADSQIRSRYPRLEGKGKNCIRTEYQGFAG